ERGRRAVEALPDLAARQRGGLRRCRGLLRRLRDAEDDDRDERDGADAECAPVRLDSRLVAGNSELRDVVSATPPFRKQAGPWLIPRRRPPRPHPFLIRTPSRAPRSSRVSVS